MKVGSRISETSWDLAVMKRSLWNLSKLHSSFKIDYAEVSLFIHFLNDASSKCMGDLIDVEDEGGVTWDIGLPGSCDIPILH